MCKTNFYFHLLD